MYGWNFKRKLTSRGANLLAQTLLQPGVRFPALLSSTELRCETPWLPVLAPEAAVMACLSLSLIAITHLSGTHPIRLNFHHCLPA